MPSFLAGQNFTVPCRPTYYRSLKVWRGEIFYTWLEGSWVFVHKTNIVLLENINIYVGCSFMLQLFTSCPCAIASVFRYLTPKALAVCRLSRLSRQVSEAQQSSHAVMQVFLWTQWPQCSSSFHPRLTTPAENEPSLLQSLRTLICDASEYISSFHIRVCAHIGSHLCKPFVDRDCSFILRFLRHAVCQPLTSMLKLCNDSVTVILVTDSVVN